MLLELQLNPAQNASLSQAITDWILLNGGIPHALEVDTVQDEDDCYKVFYTYEDTVGKIRPSWLYCHFVVQDNAISDFEEYAG
jgi:hypothetical protein